MSGQMGDRLRHEGLQAASPELSLPRTFRERLRDLEFSGYMPLVHLGVLLLVLIILGLLLARPAHGAPRPHVLIERDVPGGHVHLLINLQNEGAAPSVFTFDASKNLLVNCITGCSASAGFTDNSAFTVGGSTVNVIGAYFTSGADPACTTGNGCRLRADAASNLRVNCVVGCAGGATTPADAFANPTTAGLQFDLLAGFNGTTWDRLRSTIANGLQVDVTRVQGTVAVNNTQQGTASQNVAQFGGANIVTGTGAAGAGIPRVTVSNDSNVLATESGAWTVQPGNTANTTPWLMQGNLSNNGAAAGANRLGTLDGVAQTSYNNGAASTQGRDVAPNVGTDGLLWTAQLPAIRPASYHASASFAGSSTTFAAHLAGNASNTALVTKITFSCTQTTAGILTITVNKTSAASTGGTAATMTAVPDDSTYAAAASVAQSFTGTGPTVGTLVGQVDADKVGCNATAGLNNDIYILNLRQKPIVLRGTAQTLELGVGAAITGGNVTATFEWIETATITP